MKTINRLENKEQPGWVWFMKWLEQYDLSRLSSFSISDRVKGRRGLGICLYPKSKKESYKIRCRVTDIPFPQSVGCRMPSIYRNVDGSWAEPSDDCWVSGYKKSSNGKEWNQIKKWITFTNLDEAIVWICGHESFHFLRRTKQVPGRNDEIQADQFATDLLEKFKAYGMMMATQEWRS